MDLSPVAEPLRTIVRLFIRGESVPSTSLPPDLIAGFERLGLIRQNGGMAGSGQYRLVSHLGLLLFCHAFSPFAKLYYGNDSLALSRLLVPVEGRVLDMCAGVGAQALVCAQTAASVTAVDVEPLAARVFHINAAMNGLTDRVEYLVGDLYEPVAGRQFDRICCNPPFMPVPPGIRFPIFADGGPDGLAIIRRVLAGLPKALAPNGRCQLVGAILGGAQGPDLSCFLEMAAEANLRVAISCLWCEPLGPALVASYTAVASMEGNDAGQVFRDHFLRLGATHLHCFALSAIRASPPGVCFVHDGVPRAIILR